MARLLLGVSGGVAAYKAIETARLAVKAGHRLRVLQTRASLRFAGAASFEAVTGAPVLFDEQAPDPLRGAYPGEPEPTRTAITHLELVRRAQAYLIAPASANTIAKLAAGMADNLVCAAALAAECPVLIAPAMNNRMYEHPATQANLRRLAERGAILIDPGEGQLASHGEYGLGRLAEPPALLAALEEAARPAPGDSSWGGRRVLVTAGGTREPIDSVRFIGNRSSGRMGWALARRALERGAEVALVAANVSLAPPAGAELVPVATAAQLQAACERAFETCDVLLMAAAVADFRPRASAGSKLRKEDGVPRLELEPTEDVLSALSARRRPGQVLVGFAAEHGPGAVERGRGKLHRKGLDAVVVNDISRPGIGFDMPDNEVTIVTRDHERQVSRASKERVADAVLDQVHELIAAATGGADTGGREDDDRAVRADAARPTRV